jgi:hypothetical protein
MVLLFEVWLRVRPDVHRLPAQESCGMGIPQLGNQFFKGGIWKWVHEL